MVLDVDVLAGDRSTVIDLTGDDAFVAREGAGRVDEFERGPALSFG